MLQKTWRCRVVCGIGDDNDASGDDGDDGATYPDVRHSRLLLLFCVVGRSMSTCRVHNCFLTYTGPPRHELP